MQSPDESFKFFFVINLGFKVYSITHNLSKTIQGESISAVESQEVAGLTIKTLESMRSESNADAFYETTKIKAERCKFIEAPSLPRKRKAPNYKTLEQFYAIDGLSPTAEAYHPSNPKEHYRIIYFEVLDAVINVIKEKFDQPSFQAYLKLESFLLKVITGSCVEKEKEFLNEKYGDGDVELLESEGEVWKIIFSDLKPVCFKDILEQLKSLSEAKKKMKPNFINICKPITVNPATSCTPERSFSTARRIKTWSRSTMTNKRFNSLAILNTYKALTDDIDLLKVGNEFVSKYDERFHQFGRFVQEDFLKH